MTTPGRLASAPQGGTEPDRGTRIGFGPRRSARLPLVVFDDLSPGGTNGWFTNARLRDERRSD